MLTRPCILVRLAAVLVASLACLGCEEDKPVPTQPTTTATAKPTARATATATATASAATATAKQGNMTHCPNAVEGATTEIKDTKEGVDIVVTAKDDKATKDIRDRAKHLVDAAKADEAANAPKHTGEGQGGGQFGRCPVVMKNTLVESKEIPGGSQISVKAKEAKEADWLRREAKERQAELVEPGGKDAGQRRMANCPSAAMGATTTVKEAAGAVEVTVTAKDEAGTKDIRDRAKKIVEAAKVDPTDVKHTGDGKGGGGLGRCPVVLKDTTVEAKDVPGGSAFTVKPKKPADLAALVKESKERAETLATAPAGSAAATAAPTGAATGAPTAKPTGAPKPPPPPG